MHLSWGLGIFCTPTGMFTSLCCAIHSPFPLPPPPDRRAHLASPNSVRVGGWWDRCTAAWTPRASSFLMPIFVPSPIPQFIHSYICHALGSALLQPRTLVACVLLVDSFVYFLPWMTPPALPS